MVFYPPSWTKNVPHIPDDVPICDFMLQDLHGRHPLGYSRDPFTCGLTKKSYSALDVVDRVDYLSRALAKELGWQPNQGTEWDKVVAVFSVNTIDTVPLAWAVHRLNGLVTPANAAYSAEELTHQLRDSGAKALFTCLPLLSTALQAAAKAGLPKERIYLLEVPEIILGGIKPPAEYKTVSYFVEEGKSLRALERTKWSSGQGARQVAFLCYSSGTSGLPKGVMISHRNVISNVLQIATYESDWRERLIEPGNQSAYTDIVLNLLPQSHIYGLVVICHAAPFRGDQTIVLPRFDMKQFLSAIQDFCISSLFLVPPIIINMLRNKELCSKYDLSHVKGIFTGAAPLGAETAADLQKQYPKWLIRQGYGLTETCTVVCSTHPDHIFLGSSGCLLPGVEARIVSADGKEVTEYDTPGELLIRSPSVVLGYLNNEKATKETFQNGWMHTGDEAVIRPSPSKEEHVFIVDRIKELIKVKGLQVAPAELEAHLLLHPAVSDCTVIAVPDDAAGEVPKAFIVKSSSAGSDDAATAASIAKHVQDQKARHKWLKGGVEFIDAIPKSPSGKILRRMLRDRERELRRKAGVKL
ncbi:hypothetical protein DTO027B9_9086 [Paecilomyces variotii]|nr:hypothetical protein DTO027B9_9086 [Paecilomyces variotii]